MNWQRVSKEKPCPVCRKPDWCTVSDDGEVACCMRAESDRRLGNGGWLHRLKTDLLGDRIMAPPRPLPEKAYLTNSAIGAAWARFARTTSDEEVGRLSVCLGVGSASLRQIGACWAWPHEAWGFPMFDGFEVFTGLRLRSEDGEKWSLRGGREGIFVPSCDPPDHIVVCEGPTDAAAALSVGFYALGRPSCSGGLQHVKDFCRRHRVKKLTVCADADGPGQAGAERFCAEIGLPVRLATLPAKDLREWVGRGVQRETIESCFDSAKWR